MEVLPLDRDGYDGSYKLVGGRPSLDLVNTISWPGTERAHEWLSTTANLGDWLAAIGLDAPPLGPTDLERVTSVRRVLDDALRPLAAGSRPEAAAVAALEGLAEAAVRRRRLDPRTLSWSWDPPGDAVAALDPVVLDAVDVLTSGDHHRLRSCPSCDWLFEDQSRNGRRRWCDMADCGSRAKAKRYYHRHKD